MEYVQPIRNKKDIDRLKEYIKENKDSRYYVCFILGLYSALRISDILNLQVKDIRKDGIIVDIVTIKAEKTDKITQFPIKPDIKNILSDYCHDKNDCEYLIENKRTHNPLSRIQVYRVLRECAEQIGLEHIGTHSMRKSFGYHYYLQSKDIATLQDIYGHSSERTTKRYIGITQDTIIEAMGNFEY